MGRIYLYMAVLFKNIHLQIGREIVINAIIRMFHSRPYSTFQLNSDIGSSPTIFNYKTKGARSGIYSSTGQQYIPS